MKKKIKYPAPFLAHWSTGPVACCENHKNGLIILGQFVGLHVPVSLNEDDSKECENCKSEAK